MWLAARSGCLRGRRADAGAFPHGEALSACLCARQLPAWQTPAWLEAPSLPARSFCLLPGGFAAPGPGLSCGGILWVSLRGMWRTQQLTNSSCPVPPSALNVEGEAAPALDGPQRWVMRCPQLQETPSPSRELLCDLGQGTMLRVFKAGCRRWHPFPRSCCRKAFSVAEVVLVTLSLQLPPVFPPRKTMSCRAGRHSSRKTDILYTLTIYGIENPMAFLLKSAWWLPEHQFSLQDWAVTL